MSLQVWLPMTKDLRNQGLLNSAATVIGTTTFAAGKLGQALSCNGSSYWSIPNIILGSSASVACWSKTTVNSRMMWVLESNASEILNLFDYGEYYLNTGDSASNPYLTDSGSKITCLHDGEWHHFVVTFDGTQSLLYIDGEYRGKAKTYRNPTTTNKNLKIAGGYRNAHSYDWNGMINDFRLYDHALSPMEVKELSKGLVLHYPLNRNGWGQENLITQAMISADPWKSAISGTYTIDGKTGWILSNSQLYSKSGNGANNIFSGLTYEANTQYTISFKWRDDYRTDDKSSSLYIRFKYNDGTYSQVISSKDYNYWKEEIMTSTAGKTVTAVTTTYGNGGNLLFTDLKLEKGAIKTPTSPIMNGDLYNSMGLNSTTEYDCSGFCNNGTRTGTFTWTSNAPKYAVSQVFNGTDNAIQTPSLSSMISDKNYTIACWTYKTVIGTKNYQTIYGGPSGFELEARSSSSTSPLYRIHNWGGGTTAYNFGEWTHFCFVHTNSDSKLYVNGELKITGTSVNIPSGNYFIGAWNTATQQNFDGLMSDFRIYATALSASDVLSLYQNSAYIDSSGNVYGAVHTEV